jgi:hypothetical protein
MPQFEMFCIAVHVMEGIEVISYGILESVSQSGRIVSVRQRWNKLLTKLSAFTRPSRLMGLTKAPLSRVGAKEALERTAFVMDEDGLKALAAVSVRTRIPAENFILDN